MFLRKNRQRMDTPTSLWLTLKVNFKAMPSSSPFLEVTVTTEWPTHALEPGVFLLPERQATIHLYNAKGWPILASVRSQASDKA